MDAHTHTQPTMHADMAASALVTHQIADVCKDENTHRCQQPHIFVFEKSVLEITSLMLLSRN